MRKKKIPKSIVILGRKFKVELVSRDILFKETGVNAVGAMNYSKKRILLDESLPIDEQFVTLFHECSHAIQFVVGLNQITEPSIAEIWCESMANGFLDVFASVK